MTKRNYGDTVNIDDAPELTLVKKKVFEGCPEGYEDITTYDPKEGICIRRRKIKPHQIKNKVR
jgi:hypothetical protein